MLGGIIGYVLGASIYDFIKIENKKIFQGTFKCSDFICVLEQGNFNKLEFCEYINS